MANSQMGRPLNLITHGTMYNTYDYPNQEAMGIPILRFIAEMGGAITVSVQGDELEDKLAEHYQLTEEQKSRTSDGSHAKGGGRVWRNHIQYARNKLCHSGLLDGSTRNVWRITDDGYRRLANHPNSEMIAPIETAAPKYAPAAKIIPDNEESLFPEGKAKYRLHRKLERDNSIVELAKQRRFNHTRSLACDCCRFDFFKQYGDVGRGFIEAHHTIPVSELNGKTKTRIDDLALVCSNCHRMLHRRRPWLKLGELKDLASRKWEFRANS
jgi:hypothetical protein